MVKYLALILKNLTRNKKRTLLTVFSIAVSLFIFSALVSLPTVANQILADTAASDRDCHAQQIGTDLFDSDRVSAEDRHHAACGRDRLAELVRRHSA